MNNKVPVVRQTSWMMAIPTFAILLTLIIGSAALFWAQLGYLSITLGCAIYLFYSYGSKLFLARPLRQGLQLARQGRYLEAIDKYQQSYAFFSKHTWVDQYRYLILLSSSAISYRESSLIGIAFSYAQLGEGQQAKAYYEQTLAEFPNSGLAEAALNLIRSIEKDDAG